MQGHTGQALYYHRVRQDTEDMVDSLNVVRESNRCALSQGHSTAHRRAFPLNVATGSHYRRVTAAHGRDLDALNVVKGVHRCTLS